MRAYRHRRRTLWTHVRTATDMRDVPPVAHAAALVCLALGLAAFVVAYPTLPTGVLLLIPGTVFLMAATALAG